MKRAEIGLIGTLLYFLAGVQSVVCVPVDEAVVRCPSWQGDAESLQKVEVVNARSLDFFRENTPLLATERSHGDAPIVWKPKGDAVVESRKIATVNGRELLVYTYRAAKAQEGYHGAAQVLLHEQTNGAFIPFYIALVSSGEDRLDYQIVSGRKAPFALIASCYWSGTAAFQMHRVFTFRAACPELMETIEGHRENPAPAELEKWLGQ